MRRRIILPTAVLLFAIGCSDSPENEDPVNLNNANNQNNENNSNNANNQNNLNNANNENNLNNVTPTFGVDMRADTNRDGTIDFDDLSDDEGEDRWDATKGAIFLANMDDDEDRCPTNVNDIALAECFDGADEVVNGEADLKDFARIEIRATEVPEDATGEFRITRNADRVRLFRLRGDAYEVVNETETLSTSDLSSGVVFFLEGRDIVRDNTWDGFVDFTVTASSASEGEHEDQLQMRVAPLLMQHHLLPPRAAFASELGAGGDGAFTRDLGAAVENAAFGTELVSINVNDQWTQDYFEVAYMSMPSAEGMHTIDVFVRSANVVGRNTLRQAGRFAYFMHGEDVAGLTEVDWNHDPFWDTLNSFGNAETIPPHEGFPVGRILRGKANGLAGDNRMYGMFEAQKVQEPLYVDTGWLLVGHIDETVSFIKDHNEDSWKLVMNDAALARTMLQQAQTDGFGDSVLHSGRRWLDFRSAREIPADVTVDQMLNNANVMAASAEAAIEVAEQVEAIQTAVGLDEDRIVGVPFMHETQSGYSVAYQPGVVNGISLGDEHFGAPEMHGPIVNGADIFAEIVEERFTDLGVTVHWIEDWDMFHRFQGEVHCGSNTQRIATDAWWTSPRGGEQ